MERGIGLNNSPSVEKGINMDHRSRFRALFVVGSPHARPECVLSINDRT
jgi:hypothetical protein